MSLGQCPMGVDEMYALVMEVVSILTYKSLRASFLRCTFDSKISPIFSFTFKNNLLNLETLDWLGPAQSQPER